MKTTKRITKQFETFQEGILYFHRLKEKYAVVKMASKNLEFIYTIKY